MCLVGFFKTYTHHQKILSDIMKLLLVLIFVAGTQSAPGPQNTFADEFRAGLIKVPEGCTFLSQSQEMVGNLIKGEYTYQDPIGSKITVTYQVNRDGTDYVERRKIIKGYATDGQEKKITADQIVNQVVTELKPTVITVIKTTVANSKVDLKTYGNLVEVILTQLKPVVTAAVNNALATSPHDHLDANELITRILQKLRPFVEEALRKEVLAQKPEFTEDDIVKEVEEALEPTIISVISGAVRNSKDKSLFSDKASQEKLVQTIVTQLQPVVLQAVQRALDVHNSNGFDAKSLTVRIIREITPHVREGVIAEIRRLEQELKANSGNIIDQIIRDLSPIMKKVIEESVRNYKGDLSKYGNLVETILAQLRPVVLAQVKAALANSEYANLLDAKEMTEEIIRRLRPVVEQGVKEQARLEALRREAELKRTHDDIVAKIIAELRPIMIKVIRQTVTSSNAIIDDEEKLVQVIVRQLRPVVFAQVTTAIKINNAPFDPEELTNDIIVELLPIVRAGVIEEIAKVKGDSHEGIVSEIIQKLDPHINEHIYDALVPDETVLDQGQIQDVMAGVLQRMREIIRQAAFAVMRRLQADGTAYTMSDDEIINRVLDSIKGSDMIELIKAEIRGLIGNERPLPSDQDIQDILQSMLPEIRRLILAMIREWRAANPETVSLSSSQQDQVLSSILRVMKSQVQAATNQYLDRNPDAQDNEVVRSVIGQFQPSILTALQNNGVIKQLFARVDFASSDAYELLLQQIIQEMRSIILAQIGVWRSSQVVEVSDTASIFGTGGPNSVYVETPHIKYEYDHKK